MQGKPIAEQEIVNLGFLLETAAYAESSLCRRKILLHYFEKSMRKIIVEIVIIA